MRNDELKKGNPAGRAGVLFDLHQPPRFGGCGRGSLRGAPGIEDRNLMHTGHRAVGGTGLLGQEFPADVLE